MGLWKDILKKISWVKGRWKFSISNGSRVRFWTDPWCGIAILSDPFPSLFEVGVNKMVIVAEVWDQGVGNGSWNPRFVRAFNDWEVDLVVNLLRVLQRENVTTDEDKVSWIGVTYDRFSVSTVFKVLQSGVDSPVELE